MAQERASTHCARKPRGMAPGLAHPEGHKVRVASMLSGKVDARRTKVATGERAGIVPTTPAQGRSTDRVHAARRLGLSVPHEERQRRVRPIADDNMDVIGENCLCKNVDLVALRRTLDGVRDRADIHVPNRPLSTPRVPGDMGIQSVRLVGSIPPHDASPG